MATPQHQTLLLGLYHGRLGLENDASYQKERTTVTGCVNLDKLKKQDPSV